MFLNDINSFYLLYLSKGKYETLETDYIKKNVKNGDFVLDIGANIGYFTLILAKLIGKEGKVFAFEPEPNNFSLLSKNVSINGYKNVILINKAVSNKNGKVKLFLNEENIGDHRIFDSNDGRQSIEVETIRLDDYFKNYNEKIKFIKMDIQGAEMDAIQGMVNLIQKSKELKILSEFYPLGLELFGIEPREYLNLLIKLKFNLFSLDEKIEPINTNAFLKKYTPEKDNYTNFLCIK
ncbi:MAG: FkbM family methyltransferase [Promethearchaeota archaeon]